MNSGPSVLADYRLVAGFRFRCLPGCALCCYTTPAVAPRERSQLIRLDPQVPLRDTSGGWAQIASRPAGGACYFLRNERCECHSVRPATCGEFPLFAHVGDRVQVSIVLSCPGVDLTSLEQWGSGNPSETVSTDLSSELSSVNEEVSLAEASGQLRWAAQRRRNVERSLRRRGAWQSEEEIRSRLRPRLDRLIPRELTPEGPPEEEPELESLPMFFDPVFGRVAWRPHPGGTEFFTLRETGGIDRHLGVFAPPTQSPGLDARSHSMLRGYLAYLLERDMTISVAYELLLDAEKELPERMVSADLVAVAGQVTRMAALRRALSSDHRGELSVHDIEAGIRATDMDILDRPTAGLRL
jgi:Fe-S-cluster containining protein